jgi:hypothetical protein
MFADDDLKIDVGAELHSKSRIKSGSRFTTRLAGLIGFKRTLDHVGDGAIFAPGETVRQLPRFGAPDGQLWFCHINLLTNCNIRQVAFAIKMAADGRASAFFQSSDV